MAKTTGLGIDVSLDSKHLHMTGCRPLLYHTTKHSAVLAFERENTDSTLLGRQR